MDFQKLVRSDHQATINFFYSELEEFLTAGLSELERLYVASVLATYAETSVSEKTQVLPPFSSLSQVFDLFIAVEPRGITDAYILETAGAQSLLLTGFFRDQMRQRHNVRWYDEVGRNFYAAASSLSGKYKEREVFGRMSENFPVWAMVCRDLSRSLRDNYYLLR